MRSSSLLVTALILSLSLHGRATVFATVHGVVHDSEHRPVGGAHVALKAVGSQFSLHTDTDSTGEFNLPEAPLGLYQLEIASAGFAAFTESISVASGTNPVVHIVLSVAATNQTVTVRGTIPATDSATPTTLVTRADIDSTPGASRTLGMQMITNYVPGAYMTHDMLHMRGGHQTSWLLDGVSIPNLKIASNVGPQIDPKDIDSLEIDRGSYSADVGDRTYGVVQRCAPQRLRAQPRRGTACPGRKSLYRRSPVVDRRPFERHRLVRQSYGGALQLWPVHAGARTSIMTPPTPRACFASVIRNQTVERPVAVHRPVPPGLLPGAV